MDKSGGSLILDYLLYYMYSNVEHVRHISNWCQNEGENDKYNIGLKGKVVDGKKWMKSNKAHFMDD